MTGSEIPAGLGKRGARFWRDVTGAYELRRDESELLIELCATLDAIDGLSGSEITPGVARELRLQRGELRHLTAALGLPDPVSGDRVESGNTRRARRAANARWKGGDDGEK